MCGAYMSSYIKNQASKDAAKLLAEAWTGVIPVDPVRIARTAGLGVIDAALDQNTMGALVKKPGQDPTIMINKDDGENRRRFTCAHELGHYVKRSDATGEYTTVDLRSGLSTEGIDEDEIYANEFAASLLMPEREVRRLAKDGMADWEMAIRFKVSREAMQFRLKNLKLVR
jgi:Zn-dependent peptidase ImmA (M78 family)